MIQVARVSTDAVGLLVSQISGKQFMKSWEGLPFLVNGTEATVVSVQSSIQLQLNKSVGQGLTNVFLTPNRETVYQAFFNLVKKAPGVVTASRVPQIFSDVPPEQQPFLFVEQMGENAQREGTGIPYNWQFDVAIGICVYSPDPKNQVPASLLNPILDSIEAMLPPSPTQGAQDLDGLVVEARLLGNGKGVAGAIGNQAWAYVPARIVVV